MSTVWAYAVAFLVLSSPSVSELDELPEHTPEIAHATQRLAIAIELLDPREVRYILARPEDFKADLQLLQRRQAELRDAPMSVFSMPYPARELINDWMSINRQHKQAMETELLMAEHGFYRNQNAVEHFHAMVAKTEHLYQIWDAVRDSKCEYYYVTVRRQALSRLKTMIGERDFYAGQLPHYLPIIRDQDFR